MEQDSQATLSDQLDLSSLPPVFVSDTHFDTDELHELEEELAELHAPLTYDLREAKIILSKVTRKPRIMFDLRANGVWTEDVTASFNLPASPSGQVKRSREPPAAQPAGKKIRLGRSKEDSIVLDDSSTASEGEGDAAGHASRARRNKRPAAAVRTPSPSQPNEDDLIKVVHIDWFSKVKEAGSILPFEQYINYVGRRIPKPAAGPPTPKSGSFNPKPQPTKPSSSKAILERAREDAPAPSSHHSRTTDPFGKRKFGHGVQPVGLGGSWEAGHDHQPKLLQKTTSEFEGTDSSSDLPEPPDWVRQGIKYACLRRTPKDSPNEEFISLLKKIRTARELTNDEIGVRAYSTSIASLAAYPWKFVSPREILKLPGCETKIANLFVEYANTGTLKAVKEIDENEELKVLRLFYNIWGVGAATAREFYYERGWRDLDDIVEFGWSTLTRVQQIGVKFYDEFQDLIPRAEVEEIGRIVHSHAVQVRDEKIQSVIVGGYRRGKEASGDVDIVISHPDEEQTANIVSDIVASLEDEGRITHTLLLSLNSTNRGQQTLPFRSGNAHGGHGFDTLDKALVVWQDPHWLTKEADLAADPKAKNPNIHRRVDIIISPWRTVGCAVAGWTSGTTFQRDLRRYAKNVKGWKFDSSGVRSRENGEVVDLEGYYEYHGGIGEGRAKTMEQAEQRVFEGMGLPYFEPWDRCTG